MLRATLTLLLLTQACFGMQGGFCDYYKYNRKESESQRYVRYTYYKKKDAPEIPAKTSPIKQEEPLSSKGIPSHWTRQEISFNLRDLPNEDYEKFTLHIVLNNGGKEITRWLKVGPNGYKNSSKKVKCFLNPSQPCTASLSLDLGAERLRFNNAGNRKTSEYQFKDWPSSLNELCIKLSWNEDEEALLIPSAIGRIHSHQKKPKKSKCFLANPFDEIA